MKPIKQMMKLALLFFCIGLSYSSYLVAAETIQVGNKIKLVLPGESDFDALFEVDNTGAISIPEVGKMKVAGLTEIEAKESIQILLASAYLDLSEFRLEVAQHDIIVTVLGYVNSPSQLSVPDHGNIQMVINAANGLRAGAQLDKIQLRRDGQVYEFDYKAYLDSGDISILPKVKSGDLIFIPASPLIGNVQVEFDAQTLSGSGDASDANQAITLFGELHNPGTFSFKEDMTIVDALMRANGVTRYADVTKIRVIVNNEPQTFDLKQYLDSGDRSLLPAINAGSTIYVPIMVEDVNTSARTVYIMGEVQSPGAYEADNNAGFMDILANAGGPTRFAETRQIKVLKETGDNILFDLLAYSEGLNDAMIPEISPGDVIFVPEKSDINEKSWLKISPKRAVKVMGAVHHPGRFEWSDEMDITDLLAHAGGPTKGANINNIKVIRSGKNVQVFSLEDFSALKGNFANLPTIKAGDTIFVEELPQDPKDNKSQWVRQSADTSIYVMGQVGAPGRYSFDSKLHFLDLLAAADGPTDNADIRNIRITHRNGAKARVSKLDLAVYFETGDETLFPLINPGDTLFIPEKNKDWLREPSSQVVRLMGSVNKPGRYVFDDSMTLLDLLAEAGGPTTEAMIDKIVVVNHSCCAEQSRKFDLEKFIKQPSSANMPVLRAGDTVYVPGESMDAKRNFFKDAWNILTVVAVVAGL